jgi:hypothetical protein
MERLNAEKEKLDAKVMALAQVIKPWSPTSDCTYQDIRVTVLL